MYSAYSKLEVIYDKTLKNNPEDDSTLVKKGIMLFKCSEFLKGRRKTIFMDQAVEYFNKAVKINPSNKEHISEYLLFYDEIQKQKENKKMPKRRESSGLTGI